MRVSRHQFVVLLLLVAAGALQASAARPRLRRLPEVVPVDTSGDGEEGDAAGEGEGSVDGEGDSESGGGADTGSDDSLGASGHDDGLLDIPRDVHPPGDGPTNDSPPLDLADLRRDIELQQTPVDGSSGDNVFALALVGGASAAICLTLVGAYKLRNHVPRGVLIRSAGFVTWGPGHMSARQMAEANSSASRAAMAPTPRVEPVSAFLPRPSSARTWREDADEGEAKSGAADDHPHARRASHSSSVAPVPSPVDVDDNSAAPVRVSDVHAFVPSTPRGGGEDEAEGDAASLPGSAARTCDSEGGADSDEDCVAEPAAPSESFIVPRRGGGADGADSLGEGGVAVPGTADASEGLCDVESDRSDTDSGDGGDRGAATLASRAAITVDDDDVAGGDSDGGAT